MAKLSLTDLAAGYALISVYNANNALIEAAIENTVSRDGTTPNTMSGDLDMNGQAINNLADAVANQSPVTLQQLSDASVVSAVTTALLSTLVDAGGYYTSGNVEGALAELAAVTNPSGASIIGIWDTAGNMAATNVEDALAEIYVDMAAASTELGTANTWAAAQTFDDNIFILESAAADADVAGDGQFWVKNDAPNVPMFTDDTGGDQLLDPSISEINGQAAHYAILLSDKGKTIRFTGGTTSQVYTIPAESSINFPLGTMIGIENDGSVSMTVAITTDTMTWSKDNTTGTRTLAAGATAVIKKVASTKWKIAGSVLVT